MLFLWASKNKRNKRSVCRYVWEAERIGGEALVGGYGVMQIIEQDGEREDQSKY